MRKPKAVFLTGAGLSADSGVATYRGAGGIYRGIEAEKVMSASGLRNNPDLVHAMCDDRRVELAAVSPNPAHLVLAKLCGMYGERFVHITQNIDDLAERAGTKGSLHVHGELRQIRSIGNSKIVRDIGYQRYWSGPEELAPAEGYQFRCPKTGSRFRPGVVLFDEVSPLYPSMYKIMRNLHRDDLLVVIGTDGCVLPVARWAAATSCKKILNNLHDSAEIDSASFDVYLKDRASEVSGRIFEIVAGHLGEPDA